MSKTLTELSEELGVSKQYLSKLIKRDEVINQYVNKNGNKLMISRTGEKIIKSIVIPKITKEKGQQKDVKSSTNSDFLFLKYQVDSQKKQIENFQKLLDQSQQLLLNEQKKSQLLLETKNDEPTDWEQEKENLERELSSYQDSYYEAIKRADKNYAYATEREKRFWIAVIVTIVLFVLLLVLGTVYFFTV